MFGKKLMELDKCQYFEFKPLHLICKHLEIFQMFLIGKMFLILIILLFLLFIFIQTYFKYKKYTVV